jgi:hypothetical protein
MPTTYDVRIWKIEVCTGRRGRTYTVRWAVGGVRFREPFKTEALADSFRSKLMTAARKGEAFEKETGRPVSVVRPGRSLRWYDFVCAYMDMKWPAAAATYRRSLSEALTAMTPALLDGRAANRPDGVLLRRALHRWAFNTARRDSLECPAEIRDTLRWVRAHSLPVEKLAEPAVLRRVLDVIAGRVDGTPAAGSVVSKRSCRVRPS